MRTTMIAVLVVLTTAAAANAATYGGQAKAVPDAFTAKLGAVCGSTSFVLTATAKVACSSGAFPRLVAAGTAFVNMGTGAELNTLMRQVPAVTTASR